MKEELFVNKTLKGIGVSSGHNHGEGAPYRPGQDRDHQAFNN